MQKAILVTGATGQQGAALITALRQNQPAVDDGNSNSEIIDYHILALTRSASSEPAKALAAERHVTVVEGDLNDRASIAKIFDEAKTNYGGIWGVFAVMAFPGLNANAEGEEAQGKMLADLALEYRVSAYIYSSALRASPNHDDEEKLSGRAKVNVERHVQSLDENGLPWTIIRPSFFMENLSGLVGTITAGVLKQGLHPDTRVRLIAKEDIGNVTAGVFRNFPGYEKSIVSLVSESLTINEIEAEYQRATSHPLPSIPKPLAWFILTINSGAKDLIRKLDNDHAVRVRGEYPELDVEVERAKKAYPDIKSFYEWARQKDAREAGRSGWNQVSVWKLVTGQL